MDVKHMQKIDTKFNVIWTLIIFFIYSVDYLIFDYEPATARSDTIFNNIDNPLVACCVLLFSAILMVSAVSKLFMKVWNRLISDLFSIRNIGFAESYALCFLLTGVIGAPGFF